MEYYILLEGQKNSEDLLFDLNIIGTYNEQTKTLYANRGYSFLKKIIDLNEQSILNKIRIVSDFGKQMYTIEQFLQFLENNNIKIKILEK